MTRWLAAFCALLASPAIADAPARVVSAGGDLTEIVHALGYSDRLVGVDSTSVYPSEMRDMPQIGYVRRLAPEGIISLAPDLVLAAGDAGPPATMEILREAGVAVVAAPLSQTIDGIPAKIVAVANALDDPEGGSALARTVESEIRSVRASVDKIEARPRALFILTANGGGLVVGGHDTQADAMIRAAGGVNVAAPSSGAGVTGWKPMNTEAIIAAAPEIIILSRAHAERLGGVNAVLSRPDIALTPAGKARRGAVLDGLLLLGMGPRVAEGIRALAHAIHDPADMAQAGLSTQ